MADDFTYDVFLSHSAKDKAFVRPLAERLRADGLRVWFDDWEIRSGDNIPAKIEEGLEHSRVLVLCMSANAFGSDWAQLEAGTFRFRDPLNKERRFIPLRLDDASIKSSLVQFVYINWLPEAYERLLEACRPPVKSPAAEAQFAREVVAEKAIKLESKASIHAYAFSPDGKRALTGSGDHTVRLAEARSKPSPRSAATRSSWKPAPRPISAAKSSSKPSSAASDGRTSLGALHLCCSSGSKRRSFASRTTAGF